jgi:hypothetical protein
VQYFSCKIKFVVEKDFVQTLANRKLLKIFCKLKFNLEKFLCRLWRIEQKCLLCFFLQSEIWCWKHFSYTLANWTEVFAAVLVNWKKRFCNVFVESKFVFEREISLFFCELIFYKKSGLFYTGWTKINATQNFRFVTQGKKLKNREEEAEFCSII